MLSATEECHEPSGNCQELHIVWSMVILLIMRTVFCFMQTQSLQLLLQNQLSQAHNSLLLFHMWIFLSLVYVFVIS